MTKIKIIFIGSGPVSAESLLFLDQVFDVEAVITKSKPKHHKITPPVHEYSERLGLKIFLANSKSELDNLLNFNTFESQVAVLIDYGVIISQEAIDKFPAGIINSHFSLLPEWRGADPITFSLLSGQKQTGVSLMLLTAGMDEGPIIVQKSIDIDKEDTGISLTTKLINISNELLRDSLKMYLDKKLEPLDQIKSATDRGANPTPSYSRKITKKDGDINWDQPAENIERQVRAFQPWPRSFTHIGQNLLVNINKVLINEEIKLLAGEVKCDKNRLFIGTATQALEILDLQPAGKKNMSASEFIRGYLNKLFVQIN